MPNSETVLETSNVLLIIMLTFDDLKQKEVVLISALSRSTRCKPFSSVRPRYLPVVTWHNLKGSPQQVCLPLHLHNIDNKLIQLPHSIFTSKAKYVSFKG